MGIAGVVVATGLARPLQSRVMSEQAAGDELITSSQEAYDRLSGVSPESPCPYLPGRLFRSEAYLAGELDGGVYESLLAQGFRRSGQIVYRPRCRGCSECRQLRVLAGQFKPTRSMRRVQRRNADIRVEIGEPTPTREKFDIFRRYLEDQHDGAMSREYDAFVAFLYDSPMVSREFCYFLGEKLVGGSIADVCPKGISSVYMYFDPDFAKRSLGTFSVLWEIEYTRRLNLPYYYLGFYVATSKTMLYKSRFRPNEILVSGNRWMCFRD